jgi:hypothetical protein
MFDATIWAWGFGPGTCAQEAHRAAIVMARYVVRDMFLLVLWQEHACIDPMMGAKVAGNFQTAG